MDYSMEILDFPKGLLYGKIETLAKPHYKPSGQNSWEHIQQVYTQAAKCLRFAENRDMTPIEFAAILYHDSSVKEHATKDRHNIYGAEIARKDLALLFSEDELEIICQAIIEHDDNAENTWSTPASDLLASGDFNPPDLAWTLNKSYTWGISHGLPHQQRIQNTLAVMPKKYGSKGNVVYPHYYKTYYGKKLKELEKAMDSLTYKKVEEIVLAYREKHGLGPNDTTLPEPSTEELSAISISTAKPDDELKPTDTDYIPTISDYETAVDQVSKHIVLNGEDDLRDVAAGICHAYANRLNFHVRKVKQFAKCLAGDLPEDQAKALLEKVVHHDEDKYNPFVMGNYAPYYVKAYGGKDLSDRFEYDAGYQKQWQEMTAIDHVKQNEHHPEHWDPNYQYGKNTPPFNAEAMPDVSLQEMLCDWMAVAYEKGNTALEWFEKQNKTYLIFSDRQQTLIRNLLKNEKGYINTVRNTEQHFVKLEDAEHYLQEHFHGHGKIFDEETKRVIRSCRCPRRIHEALGIPEVYVRNGIAQFKKRESEMFPSAESFATHPTSAPIPPDDIHDLNELAEFYQVNGQYGTVIDGKKYIGSHLTEKVIDKIKILTPEEQLRYHVGTCYDTVGLTLWYAKRFGFDFRIFFFNTRAAYDNVAGIWNDPTHLAIILKTRSSWCWLEGSWGRHKGTKNFSSENEALQHIAKTFRESIGGKSIHAWAIPQYPGFGLTIHEFYRKLMSTGHMVFSSEELMEANPNATVSLEALGLFNKPRVSDIDEFHYRIEKFPLRAFQHRLHKLYHTTRIDHLVESLGFKIFGGFSHVVPVSMHKFFVPELIYLLQKLEMSQLLISDIQTGTWISQDPPVATQVHWDAISQEMNCTLLDYQRRFLETYPANKDKSHLRGYLLSFEQGLGKTLTSLALMTGLKKDVTIILCPKNTMLETWKAHLDGFFRSKQSVYVIDSNQEYKGERWFIINYDSLSKLDKVVPKLKGKSIGLIVDESHNFLRVEANRTQGLMRLVQEPDLQNRLDVLLMSGTPIKCFGVEMIPLIRILDPLFDEEAAGLFKKAFGLNTEIAADILHNRLIRMMTRETKAVLNLPEKKESVVKVQMPTGGQYTVEAVKKAIFQFIIERERYHQSQMPVYQKEWDESVAWMDEHFQKDPNYKFWKDRVQQLIDEEGHFQRGDQTIVKMNTIETTILEPALPKEILVKFRHCKAAIKYLHLKIRGEVLGQCIGRLRISMTTELMQACNLADYINSAEKKTIIFTSFVDTIEVTEKYCQEKGFKPIAIYGKTSKDLADLVKTFQTDPSYNPLIASLQTLATGATLTAANRVIFLNKPWRSADYQQASDRVHRIGQDTEVEIISIVLDTGEQGNLSTRMEDIMNMSDMLFGKVVTGDGGNDQTGDPDVSAESFEDKIGRLLEESYTKVFLNPKVSTEAMDPNAKSLRKKIEDYIIRSINLMERTSKVNETYWRNRFKAMSDADFDKFMHCLKDGTENIHMYVPPLKVHLRNADLIDAAHRLGVKLMHRIWMTDDNTGLKYLTPEEYLVIQLPVRRQQQLWDEKVSVPEDDKQVDGMTGQVTGDSKACAITNPEIHIMQARNLDASLYEYVNVRGGNIHNYGEFKRSLEETGRVSLKQLDGTSRTRVAVVAGILLRGMMLDSNFDEPLS